MTLKRALPALMALLIVSLVPVQAHALDKRLKLAMKTAGYGAAAGLVIGAGTMALGLGGYKNILMGTSSGLYAGLGLAAYIIATPNEDESANRNGPRNPYAPRRAVGPNDYDPDEEGLEEHLPPQKQEPDSQVLAPRGFEVAMAEKSLRGQREKGVWIPVLSLSW